MAACVLFFSLRFLLLFALPSEDCCFTSVAFPFSGEFFVALCFLLATASLYFAFLLLLFCRGFLAFALCASIEQGILMLAKNIALLVLPAFGHASAYATNLKPLTSLCESFRCRARLLQEAMIAVSSLRALAFFAPHESHVNPLRNPSCDQCVASHKASPVHVNTQKLFCLKTDKEVWGGGESQIIILLVAAILWARGFAAPASKTLQEAPKRCSATKAPEHAWCPQSFARSGG